MKILFVRTYCPNRVISGSEMRSDLIADYLAQKGEVDLLTLTAPGPHTDMPYIQAHFHKHYYFDQQDNPPRMGSLEKLLNLAPWQVAGYYAEIFQHKLNTILKNNHYDLIFVFKLEPIFFFLKIAPYWRERTVVDFDDILSDLYLNYYKNILTARKNSCFLKLYEQRGLKYFKRIFVCSEDAV